MERDVAIRIDGMLVGISAYMDGIAHYMKHNLSDNEYKAHIGLVGATMGETIELSDRLHAMFPDIIPKEIDPNYIGI